ncbi:MAG: hypothetical protein LBD59_01635 [Prevotellaceae bacterium]|jgi:hypothetical protein|nr:hypothetical protein [Prevotellaceae bacterium]
MKIKSSKETHKWRSIETALYGIAQASISISVAVLIHGSIDVLNYWRTVVWKCRDIAV